MAKAQPGKSIDLALQGGGSHGAFTWGVLDRLLADGRIDIAGVSGTSAGAMNAVVLAHGLRAGGREGARQALRGFWREVGRADAAPFHFPPFAALFRHWRSSASPLQRFYGVFSRLVSPYQLNPFNFNPLRKILERHVDFAALRATERPRLFVCATNVRTGHPRVFRNAEISRDAVLASACMPVLFHAVEIDGEHYWDGGYSSNPALLPLVAESDPGDLVLVQINPMERPGVPDEAHEIIDRINEISFNSSLNQELRTLALIKEALREGHARGAVYGVPLFRRIEALHLHRVEAQKELAGFGASSKLNPAWRFLERLHEIGYRTADEWLAAHFDDIGQRSTIDLLRDVAQEADVPSLAEQGNDA